MVNPVLERLYRAGTVVHRNGKTKPLVPPGVPPAKGDYLFRLVRALRPAQTLEIGFAYGVSTLFIAEALRQNGRGRHIVIDPYEHTKFDGLGLRHVEEAGLDPWVTFYEEPAESCLPRLALEGVDVDIAFNDSGHLFDHVVTEFVLLTPLLHRGSVLVFDDPWLPGVARACDFVATNRPDFAEVVEATPGGIVRRLLDGTPVPPPGNIQVRVFRKVEASDPRDWNHFVPF